MDKIAVLTSGGDAPGMNAAIRAVVRSAIFRGWEVIGVKHGFNGLIYGDFINMTVNSVGDIIQRGGTILHTARSREFYDANRRREAGERLREAGADSLVVIGGNGSQAGGHAFCQQGINVIGIPASIDNDIPGTDITVGYDTAINTVIDAINRIRDTATSHERVFIVEVMGRKSGQIALAAGLAGGAESILLPEIPFDFTDILARINSGIRRGKLHSIIVVAEGACSALALGKEIERLSGQETRTTILGHTQRGGGPTAADRVLASRLGKKAVDLIAEGQRCKMVGRQGGELVAVDLLQVVEGKKEINLELYETARILSI